MADHNDGHLGVQAAEWVRRRAGVVTGAQLVALGVPRSTVKSWVRTGRLSRIHRDVYAVGHLALRPEGWWRAAVLAGGSHAVLSHASAVQLLGHAPADRPVHVTTPRTLRARPGLVTHTSAIDPRDVRRVRGIPVTSLERTLVDLADTLAFAEIRALADRPRRLDVRALARLRTPGRRGAGSIGLLLERDVEHTKSEFERRYVRFCRRTGLPVGDERNVFVAGVLVDVRYPAQRVCVELDTPPGCRRPRLPPAPGADGRGPPPGHRAARRGLEADPAGLGGPLRRRGPGDRRASAPAPRFLEVTVVEARDVP